MKKGDREKDKANDLGLKALKNLVLRVWSYFMWLTVQSSNQVKYKEFCDYLTTTTSRTMDNGIR
jgi:hypothetical protein